MKKWIGPALLVTAALLASCGRGGAPPRPQGVPSNAMWIGGPDGGVFAVIQFGATAGEFHADIYADTTGATLFTGRLVLDWPVPPIERPDDPLLYDGWDGQAMLLRDGRRLQRR